MKGQKAIFLFLALLLPIGIFIFLRTFGKNEFDVPAFHQDKVTAVAGCTFAHQAPYSLPDSVMSIVEQSGKNDLYLVNFTDGISGRIKQEVKHKEISFIDGNSSALSNDKIKKCVLLIPASEDMVAIDKNGKIRGYYTSTDREEVDRLLLEIEILLKKY
jgi:hypothetical protein